MSGERATERILVAVRHGQTDWNVEQRFQGQLDIPLNPVGYSQAEELKTRLTGLSFDAVYSSPLRRAMATAHVVVANGVPISIDNRLIEIHHGEWQGRTKSQIAKRWPREWDRWNSEPQRFTPEGGESAEYLRARVEDFLRTMQGTTVLCVSHGVVIQTLLSVLVGGRYLDPKSYEPANGSIHTLWFQNGRLLDYRLDSVA